MASFVSPARAQQNGEKTQRLYIRVSNNLTIQKENRNEQKLIIKDYLSSSRITDSNQQTQNQGKNYFPYGDSIGNEELSTDRQFTGHRLLDDAGGVYHAGARFYNPQLGIFAQADTAEGPNRYRYGANNPISYNDPSGHAVCLTCKNPYSEKEYQGQDGNPFDKFIATVNHGFGIGSITNLVGNTLDFMIGLTPDDPRFGQGPINKFGNHLNSYNKYLSTGDAMGIQMMGSIGMVTAGGLSKLGSIDSTATQVAQNSMIARQAADTAEAAKYLPWGRVSDMEADMVASSPVIDAFMATAQSKVQGRVGNGDQLIDALNDTVNEMMPWPERGKFTGPWRFEDAAQNNCGVCQQRATFMARLARQNGREAKPVLIMFDEVTGHMVTGIKSTWNDTIGYWNPDTKIFDSLIPAARLKKEYPSFNP